MSKARAKLRAQAPLSQMVAIRNTNSIGYSSSTWIVIFSKTHSFNTCDFSTKRVETKELYRMKHWAALMLTVFIVLLIFHYKVTAKWGAKASFARGRSICRSKLAWVGACAIFVIFSTFTVSLVRHVHVNNKKACRYWFNKCHRGVKVENIFIKTLLRGRCGLWPTRVKVLAKLKMILLQ